MKPNKPIGRINSGLRSIYLVLRIVLTCFVLYMALSRCSLLASAATTLTPEQTSALYGSSFPCTFYNKSTGVTHNLTFNLVGRSDVTWMPSDAPSGTMLNIQGYKYMSGANQTWINNCSQAAPFLIYSCTVQPFVYNDSTHVTMQFNFPVNMHISRYSGLFLSSIGSFAYPHDISFSSGKSIMTWNTSFDSFVTRETPKLSASSYVSSVIVPATGSGSYIGSYSDDDLLYFQTWPLYLDDAIYNPSDSTALFDVQGISVDLKRAAGYIQTGITNATCTIYFLIQCPTVESYQPATTTQPVTGTTRSVYTGNYFVTTPQYTYDLSPLETNQLNQIRIQNEQLQYESGVFDGVNIMIQQLNDIYNAMIARGEISVDLVGGFDWSMNTDVANFINNAVTSYTMASITPSDYFATPNNIYDLFGGYNWLKPFAVVGGFSTAFGIFCWFVFRGRKGG